MEPLNDWVPYEFPVIKPNLVLRPWEEADSGVCHDDDVNASENRSVPQSSVKYGCINHAIKWI